MKRITLIKIYFLTIIVLISGCKTSPPKHCANWWYYWKEGEVVEDMDKVKYLWENPPKTVGISAPSKTQTLVGLSDYALKPIKFKISRTNKYNKLLTIDLYVPRDGGIDGVSEVIAHEFKHIWIYQQWGANIKMTGIINGLQHSDGDAIPDIVENGRTPGSIGYIYEFNPLDPDTYNLQLVLGWEEYKYYGDNEVLARIEGIKNPRINYPEKDWSKGGKQWRK